MIPSRNARNLMLRRDVAEAVHGGCFHVWAVETVDQGIELLTGIPAGARVDGRFPEGTVNCLVEEKLRSYAEKMKHFSEKSGKAGRQ
jgi:predicted ATP-dependent protease